MKRYIKIKEQYPDCMILFRDENTYNCYYDDAKKLEEIIGEKCICNRSSFLKEDLDKILPRIIRLGQRVIIVDQNY